MNTDFDFAEYPHRRYNPLTGEYVLVSPHRTKRPWQGDQSKPDVEERPAHDPTCYLCPGNSRAGGATNPDYDETFVFANDFAALLPESPPLVEDEDTLFRASAVRGTCRVVCFSPLHNRTLPEMPVETIRKVVDLWAGQTAELLPEWRWVQVFENKGSVMGCSNPHPHGQIWTGSELPNEPAKEDANQRAYLERKGIPLLVDYARQESGGERVVEENEDWIVVVPWWALWPYETLLIPKRHVLRLPDLIDTERDSLADVLKKFLSRYDNLFEVSFPYSMGWHGAPGGPAPGNVQHWQLHAHFFPPLLRSATVKKFMVGYEMLGEAQRDLTAEQAAAKLRALPNVHYREGTGKAGACQVRRDSSLLKN